MNMTSEKSKDSRLILEKADNKPEFSGYSKGKRKNQFLVKLSVKEYCIYCG